MQTCKICGKKTRIIKDTQFQINYHHCEFCEFISMDESSEISFEEERDVYDLHNNSIDDEGYVTYLKNFIDSGVMPFVKENDSRFLDFGSGPEPVLNQILMRDYGISGDVYDLHYQPNKEYLNRQYDVITSTEVFEHLKEPLETIRELKERLDVGGILSFMTLLHNNNDETFKDWWYRRDETHISFFSEKTIEVIAKKLDLCVVYNDSKRIITFKRLSS